MLFKSILSLVLMVCLSSAWAAPYSQMAEADWQVAKDRLTLDRNVIDPGLGTVRVHIIENNLISTYYFTKDIAKSHPAMIKVQVIKREDGYEMLRQGWFSGNEEEFKKWYSSIIKQSTRLLNRVDNLDIANGLQPD